jgi:starvation-inducible DNA-binding protein
MMEELQKAAKVAFASTFSFYLKSHNFHWNVEGRDFYQYHKLFGKIYDEVFDSIDDFAEQIRSMNTYVPGSFSRFSMLTQIDDETSILPPEAMIQELIEDNEKMIKILKLTFQMSEKAGEYGFSDFIAGRMDAHRKHGWMLRATSKGNETI